MSFEFVLNMEVQSLPLLVIRFDNEIQHREISLFRGAVIAALTRDNVLFHNHEGENYRYSYPLIQYKRLSGKAAIVCVKSGVEAIADFFSSQKRVVKLGHREVELSIADISTAEFSLSPVSALHSYRLTCWQPLNSENYRIYQSETSMIARLQMLERILKGHILSLGKGLDYYWDTPLECHIVNLLRSYPMMHKGVRLMAFDLDITCNLRLPSYIGLGKNASIGGGVLKRQRSLVPLRLSDVAGSEVLVDDTI